MKPTFYYDTYFEYVIAINKKCNCSVKSIKKKNIQFKKK